MYVLCRTGLICRIDELTPLPLNVGGEPGWVVIARTRHKDIHVGSVATSCRSRSWKSLPTLTLDTPLTFPMDSTIVAEGV